MVACFNTFLCNFLGSASPFKKLLGHQEISLDHQGSPAPRLERTIICFFYIFILNEKGWNLTKGKDIESEDKIHIEKYNEL